MYIGRLLSTIGDDETGKQFKEKASELLSKLPLKDDEREYSIITEGWYDG